MEKQKILYLSYDGMTDPLGQSQVLPYLCGLAKYGYLFTLISFEKPARFSTGAAMIRKIAAENNIDWQPLAYTKKPPVISTIKDIMRMRRLAALLQQEKNFDIVHCRGHIPAIAGLFLKRRYGIKFLFDNRGFWPDEKVDAGAWKLSNPVFKLVYQYFKKKEKQFIQQADHIVCLTHKGKAELLRWGYVEETKSAFSVIPCCADTILFDPACIGAASTMNTMQAAGIKKTDVVLSYLGSIGTWYMLPEMLDFFIYFKQQVPAAKFLFITQDEHELIRRQAAEKGIDLSDIVICAAQRKEVPALLSLSKFSIFFIRPSYSKISSSPTKQGEIMAMGIPVICNAGIGDTDDIVKKYHSGIVTRTDADNYNETVKTLLTTNFDTTAIRAGAIDYFSLENGLAQYAGIYEKLAEMKQ